MDQSHSHVQLLAYRRRIYLLLDKKKSLSGPAASIGVSVRYAVSNVETIKTGTLRRGLRPSYR